VEKQERRQKEQQAQLAQATAELNRQRQDADIVQRGLEAEHEELVQRAGKLQAAQQRLAENEQRVQADEARMKAELDRRRESLQKQEAELVKSQAMQRDLLDQVGQQRRALANDRLQFQQEQKGALERQAQMRTSFDVLRREVLELVKQLSEPGHNASDLMQRVRYFREQLRSHLNAGAASDVARPR
jgi:chromosome segregation ATPase